MWKVVTLFTISLISGIEGGNLYRNGKRLSIVKSEEFVKDLFPFFTLHSQPSIDISSITLKN